MVLNVWGMADAICLFPFKAMIVELQSAAVFGDRANYLVGCPSGKHGFYFQRNSDLGANLSSQMRNYFFRDSAGIATDASWVEAHSSVKTA